MRHKFSGILEHIAYLPMPTLQEMSVMPNRRSVHLAEGCAWRHIHRGDWVDSPSRDVHHNNHVGARPTRRRLPRPVGWPGSRSPWFPSLYFKSWLYLARINLSFGVLVSSPLLAFFIFFQLRVFRVLPRAPQIPEDKNFMETKSFRCKTQPMPPNLPKWYEKALP